MSVRKFYKFRDKSVFLDKLKEFTSARDFGKKANIINSQVSRYVKEDSGIIGTNAIKIANTMGIEFDEMFYEVNINFIGKPSVVPRKKRVYAKCQEKDKTDFIVSEEIICGLKKNIQDRLSITHSQSYVNDIMSLINELVIESSYLGVNSTVCGKEEFIVNAITKRRSKP